MLHSRRVFTIFLALVLLTLMAPSVTLAQDPEQGKVIWEEQSSCSNCHVAGGQGVWGPPLEGNDHSAGEWIEQVRNPRRNMPNYSESQISDEAIIDLHAYLTSLERPETVTRGDAGLAEDAHSGQKLIVSKRCVACHSATGPINGFIKRGEIPTVEVVLNQVRNPRMWMPAYRENQVSDEEVALMVEFMASQIEPAEVAEESEAEETEMEESEAEEMPMTVPELDPNLISALFGFFLALLGFLG